MPAKLRLAYHADSWVVRGKFSSKQSWKTKQAARANRPRRISRNTLTTFRTSRAAKAKVKSWLSAADRPDTRSTKAAAAAHCLRSKARIRNNTNRNEIGRASV